MGAELRGIVVPVVAVWPPAQRMLLELPPLLLWHSSIDSGAIFDIVRWMLPP